VCQQLLWFVCVSVRVRMKNGNCSPDRNSRTHHTRHEHARAHTTNIVDDPHQRRRTRGDARETGSTRRDQVREKHARELEQKRTRAERRVASGRARREHQAQQPIPRPSSEKCDRTDKRSAVDGHAQHSFATAAGCASPERLLSRAKGEHRITPAASQAASRGGGSLANTPSPGSVALVPGRPFVIVFPLLVRTRGQRQQCVEARESAL
jgi:hypothetical protein